MYNAFLVIHSVVRWIVLVTGAVAVARGISGMTSRRAWTPGDNRAGVWFVSAIDAQFLIGAILYLVLSPFTMAAWDDVAGTMQNPALRFVAVEHPVGMLIGLALAHIGRVRIRKTTDAARRHRLAAIFFGISLIVTLLSIPWPGTMSGRPLLRGFSASQP